MAFWPYLFNQNFRSSGPSAYDLAVIALAPKLFLQDAIGPIGDYPSYNTRLAALNPISWFEDVIGGPPVFPEYDTAIVSITPMVYVPGDQVIPD